ncbi:hypothetical protein [Elongatibacter sediminis]|uniref:Carbohydrate-binding family V/XII n=1 Tax=Elongatibacter sediminis TaxID=3119006 RepID=A0AAW9RDV3_9GAMM
MTHRPPESRPGLPGETGHGHPTLRHAAQAITRRGFTARAAAGFMLALITALVLATSPRLHAADSDWPRTLAVDEGTVTIYRPMIDGLDETVLHYRAALAWRASDDAEPVFGAGWFDAPVDIDRNKRTVHPKGMTLQRARFPDGTTDIGTALTSAVAAASPRWNLDFPLDDLQAALEAAEAESTAAREINTAPPRIIYRDRPALLVQMDGDPVLRDIEESPYQAVINTPYPLISDGREFYLNAAPDVWYRADSATGPYRFDASPPADIAAMVKASQDDADNTDTPPEEDVEPVTAENAPEIVVSTVPAELLVTEGPADFAPLVDDLLVLQNSDDDVFMHVGSQQYYIVLAGRWYRAPSLNGPWAYESAELLPPAFASIPENSAQADARVYVAGTDEAQEAVLDAQVPQTAAIQRGEVDVEVQYDGDPRLEPVDGTEDLRYVRNTGATVLYSDRVYYLVEDGVWYVSTSPNGPWQVADRRPAEVDYILPSSPVYNTKYVYIYDSTPEVVYVGYTPGYTGSYVHHGTIVYGTGWYYRPWVTTHYYYPRHSTWGFHVGYTPWYGWSFGLSWGWGPFSLSYYTGGYWHEHRPWYHRHYGYWGPRGYRHHPRYYDRYRHYGHGYPRNRHARYDRYDRYDRYNRYDRRDRYGRYDRRARPGERTRNLYHDAHQRAPVADRNRGFARNDSRDRNNPANRVISGPDAGNRSRGNARSRVIEDRKIGLDRAGPVKTSDLRMKARVRDDRSSSRQKQLAGGKETRLTRSAASAKPGRNRTEPVTRSELHARADNLARNRVVRTPQQRSAPARTDKSVAARNRTGPVSRNELQTRADRVKRSSNPTQASRTASGRTDRETTRRNRTVPVSRGALQARAAQIGKAGNKTQPARNKTLNQRSATRPESRSSSQNRSQTQTRSRAVPATPRSTQARRTPAPVTRRASTNTRTTSSRQNRPVSIPERRTVTRQAPKRSASPAARQATPRSAPSRSAPARQARPQASRSVSAPSRSAPRRQATQRAAAPSRNTPSRSAAPKPTQRKAPARSRGAESAGRRGGERANGRRSRND